MTHYTAITSFQYNYCSVNYDEFRFPPCRKNTPGDSNVNMYCTYLLQYQGEPGQLHIFTGCCITTLLRLSSHWETVYTLDKYSVHPFIQIKHFVIFCLQLIHLTFTRLHTQINIFTYARERLEGHQDRQEPETGSEATNRIHSCCRVPWLDLWDLTSRKGQILSL